jgi:hypothetical protein
MTQKTMSLTTRVIYRNPLLSLPLRSRTVFME